MSLDTVTFDSDNENATITGHRYPDFCHDGHHSLVLLVDSMPCAILGYDMSGPLQYVLQLQGSRDPRPPKGWEFALLGRFAHDLFTREDGFIVQSGANNFWADEFHSFLVQRGVYDSVGLGTPSLSDAVGFDARERDRVSQGFMAIPEEERISAHLHPSTAFVRYDVTARRVARSTGASVTVLDPALAKRYDALTGDLLISR